MEVVVVVVGSGCDHDPELTLFSMVTSHNQIWIHVVLAAPRKTVHTS